VRPEFQENPVNRHGTSDGRGLEKQGTQGNKLDGGGVFYRERMFCLTAPSDASIKTEKDRESRDSWGGGLRRSGKSHLGVGKKGRPGLGAPSTAGKALNRKTKETGEGKRETSLERNQRQAREKIQKEPHNGARRSLRGGK